MSIKIPGVTARANVNTDDLRIFVEYRVEELLMQQADVIKQKIVDNLNKQIEELDSVIDQAINESLHDLIKEQFKNDIKVLAKVKISDKARLKLAEQITAVLLKELKP